jgi:menaquinone-specific isochorismate synthase
MLMTPPTRQKQLISASRRIAPVALLDFLQTTVGQPRIYWEHGDTAFAGYGAAVIVTADGADRFELLRQQADDLFENIAIETDHPLIIPRLFGGFSFQADFQPDSMWKPFAPAYFILPRYVISRIADQVWFTVNAYDETPPTFDTRKISANLARTTVNFDVDYPLPLVAWREQITNATRRMKAGELQKVVLSRSCDLIFDTPVNPVNALTALTEKYPDTYRFLIEPAAGWSMSEDRSFQPSPSPVRLNAARHPKKMKNSPVSLPPILKKSTNIN